MRILFTVFAALIVVGCLERDLLVDLSDSRGPTEIDLRSGQSVLLAREGLLITFTGVTGDSRCPIGAMCVWAGDAGSRLVIRPKSSEASACTLHTTLDPKFVSGDGVTVRLKQLNPYPRLGGSIDPADYVSTLEITRSRMAPM